MEMRRKIMGVLLMVILVILIILLIILFWLSPGKMIKFTDNKGNVKNNSISEKTFIDINGIKMGMIIKSMDISNPVLLFVHGGPGMPEYFLNQDYPTGLEKFFTVVWWDQRGAGLSYYSKIGDQETLKELKDKPYPSDNYRKIRDSVMHKAGIGTTHNMTSVVKDIFLKSLANKEYTVSEKINLWRGKIFSASSYIKKEEENIDFRTEITSLSIPIYFISGKYDYTVNYEMSEEYLKCLDAPVKKFYLFENSAYSPLFEEPKKWSI